MSPGFLCVPSPVIMGCGAQLYADPSGFDGPILHFLVLPIRKIVFAAAKVCPRDRPKGDCRSSMHPRAIVQTEGQLPVH